jgi:hypothetical protein
MSCADTAGAVKQRRAVRQTPTLIAHRFLFPPIFFMVHRLRVRDSQTDFLFTYS